MNPSRDIKVIAFVGMPGAGKSVCVHHLDSKGLPSVYFGGITINEVKARGLEVNETNEKLVREEIRAKEGKDAYARRIIAQINDLAKDGHTRIVVDGLYSWTEYKVFKEAYGSDVIIVAVAANRHLRHQRLASRPLRPFTNVEAMSRDYAEIENLEKGGPIANADYTLLNNGTREELIAQLDEVLKDAAF